MQISKLIPRPLEPASGTETVTFLTALFTQIHLDRRRSRALGWRGMRPSFTHSPAWTLRTARSDAIYGLVLLDESAADGLITGRYALYAFPDPASRAAARMTPAQRALACAPGFRDRIREMSANAETLAPFIRGEIEVTLNFAGDGLAITLTAYRSDFGFEICAPLFALVAGSARAVFEDEGELVLVAERDAEETAGLLRLSTTAAWGRFTGLIPGRRMKALHFAHRPSEEESSTRPVIHVLTGFLGSGKTTFLRQWLAHLHGRERFTGVLQNEFGEVDLDSLVLSGETRVEALDEGCVCCTLADSLRPGIERLLETTPAEQFILETTGVADPMNVMYELLALNDLVERGLLISVVDGWDATRRDSLGEPGPDADVRRSQVLNADVLVVSKADALDEEKLSALMRRLHEMNPDALIVPASHGSIPFAVLDAYYLHWLDARGRGDRKGGRLPSREAPRAAHVPTEAERAARREGGAAPAGGLFGGLAGAARTGGALGGLGTFGGLAGLARNDAAPAAGEVFATRHVRFDRPVSVAEIRALIDGAGAGLDRAKGLVMLAGDGPSLIQYSAGVLAVEAADDATISAARRAGVWNAPEAPLSDGLTDRPAAAPEAPAAEPGKAELGFLVLIGRNVTENT